MTTWQDALKTASNTSKWRVGYCDNFVANMWGESASGYTDAIANWNASPGKVTGSQAVLAPAPAGALYYWGGGHGHVALSAGDGTVYSTDIGGAGTVTRVPVQKITLDWNKPFLGWAPPYFNGKSPGAVGPNNKTPHGKSLIDQLIGSIEGTVSSVVGGVESTVGGIFNLPSQILDGFKSGTDFLTEVLSVFKAFFQPSTYIRIGAGLFGLVFLVAGFLFIVREATQEGGSS